MKYTIFLAVIFIQCAVGNLSFSQVNPPPETRPNFLIIIADDMSLHAGIYGDKTISTTAIDNLGRTGVIFDNAFCTASSCSPSRASILTGRYPHQLKEGGNLWGTLPVEYPNYTRVLMKNGYKVGLTGKGWGPGYFLTGGYKENPAGPEFETFTHFISDLPDSIPFCYWIGSHDPHRPYNPDLKETVQLKERQLRIPSWLPDNELVREDLIDYYAEVNRFDQTVADAISLLKKEGLYENTLIIITSDNGMPFPRAKANVYDAGTRIPLIMRWGSHFENGKRYAELVSLVDLAPTILKASQLPMPKTMTGKSLIPLLTKGISNNRYKSVFLERERHANVRKNELGYPVRAVRTPDYLYIHNLRPERWPAGDPALAGRTSSFGDIDNGLTKKYIIEHQDDPKLKNIVHWCLEKRPAEELYDLKKDPDQLLNVAHDPSYSSVKKQLHLQLEKWRRQTNDPVNPTSDIFDTYIYKPKNK